MSDIAIRVENLSKKYRIGRAQQRHDTLRDAVSASWRGLGGRLRRNGHEREDEIWALKDVSFEVKRGEVVGVIGRNGAGKSTLLKILSQITEPTSGRAEIHGRVGSLLEVGTGFHPELTGRENIYLSGAMLGMRREEIGRKFDEIVDFSGVEKFIDTPIKRYSSGMNVRLGFAVAAHLEPEILLVDEVLAVGDAAFQRKCLGKMGDVAREGRTVLFVSHNIAAIQSLCSEAVWLNQGQLLRSGNTENVVGAYVQSVVRNDNVCLRERSDRQGNGGLYFTEFRVFREQPDSTLICGYPAHLEMHYEALVASQMRDVHISVGINSLLGESILYLSNDLVGVEFSDLPERGKFVCRIDKLPLTAGTYSVNLYCTTKGELADWIIDAARMVVEQGDYFGTGRLTPKSHSRILVPQLWQMEAKTRDE